MKTKVEISARHIHLTEEAYKKLFGEEKPIEIKELSQKDIACQQSVEIIGPKKTIPNVRVLVPFREKTQLEISKTDSILLGIQAPLRLSGDLPGASIKVKGHSGEIEGEFAIIAKRHLHLSPDVARSENLKDGDNVRLNIDGDRGLEFGKIVVRVKDHFTPAVHIDTDEANAAGLSECSEGEILYQ